MRVSSMNKPPQVNVSSCKRQSCNRTVHPAVNSEATGLFAKSERQILAWTDSDAVMLDSLLTQAVRLGKIAEGSRDIRARSYSNEHRAWIQDNLAWRTDICRWCSGDAESKCSGIPLPSQQGEPSIKGSCRCCGRLSGKASCDGRRLLRAYQNISLETDARASKSKSKRQQTGR